MCIAILDRLGEPIDASHTAAIATNAIRAITRLLAASPSFPRTTRAPTMAGRTERTSESAAAGVESVTWRKRRRAACRHIGASTHIGPGAVSGCPYRRVIR